MRKFDLDNKFEVIIVTFRTFQHLYTVEDQLQSLKNIKSHLKPGGVFVFDVYVPSLKYIEKGNWQWIDDEEIKLPGIKGKTKIDYRNRYDMGEQIMYQEYRFRYPNGEEKTAPFKMRFFFRFEIEHLLALADFKVKNLYGDFMKGKFTSNSPEMVWIAAVE